MNARLGGGWRALRHGGELAMTLGVVVLLFAAYQLFARPAEISGAQRQLSSELEHSWLSNTESETPSDVVWPGPDVSQPGVVGEGGGVAVGEGVPLVRLQIPAQGLRWAVVEGVSPRALRGGPGHYPGTAMPGQIGNFAVAGHRARGVFFDLDELNTGDSVLVETKDVLFTYQVYRKVVVGPRETSVVAPNPDTPGAAPTRSVLTLTTCDPWWSTSHRLIVHAALIQIQPKLG